MTPMFPFSVLALVARSLVARAHTAEYILYVDIPVHITQSARNIVGAGKADRARARAAL